MPLRAVTRTMSLGVLSSGFGLLSVLYIVWIFGTAEFAIFTIALAKLSIILLGLEIVPSQYSLFKMQGDPDFSESISSFYLAFGILALAVTAIMVATGIIASNSWLIIPYAFLSVTQLYLEVKIQSSGLVGAFGRMPSISNLARVLALVALSLPLAGQQPADAIWGSLCIGSALGQAYVLLRFPELGHDLIKAGPVDLVRHLVSVRSQYSGYIVNSVLKRVRELVPSAVLRPGDSFEGRNLAGCSYILARSRRCAVRCVCSRRSWSTAPSGRTCVTRGGGSSG